MFSFCAFLCAKWYWKTADQKSVWLGSYICYGKPCKCLNFGNIWLRLLTSRVKSLQLMVSRIWCSLGHSFFFFFLVLLCKARNIIQLMTGRARVQRSAAPPLSSMLMPPMTPKLYWGRCAGCGDSVYCKRTLMTHAVWTLQTEQRTLRYYGVSSVVCALYIPLILTYSLAVVLPSTGSINWPMANPWP